MTARRTEVLFVELLGGFGDLLLALPAVHAVARSVPGARVTVATFDPGGELLLVGGRAVVLGTSQDGLATTITTVDLADPTSPSIVDATTVTGRASAMRCAHLRARTSCVAPSSSSAPTASTSESPTCCAPRWRGWRGSHTGSSGSTR